jgi:hypothetical protein
MKLDAIKRSYLREARFFLSAADLAVRFVTSKIIFKWADRPPKRILRFSGYQIPWISWAIEFAGAKKPCLARALAAQYMLRRRGIDSRVCLGVTSRGHTIGAHAWLEIGERVILGSAERPGFTKLASFGGRTIRGSAP